MIFLKSRNGSRRRSSLRFAATVALSALLWSSAIALPASAEVAAAEPQSKLERQVESWVATLSKQKPFQDWQAADPQIAALGPGTHSWLVLFTKEGRDIGYMVVHAVTDGSFQLGEYGIGPYSLYSLQQLKRSLVYSGLLSEDEVGLIAAAKQYVHPFAAAWEVRVGEHAYWLDAKTAEQLPVDKPQWTSLFSGASPFLGQAASPAVDELKLNELFDAYERLPWLTKEAPFPAEDAKKLQKRLDSGKPLRYVTEPFGDAMLYAAPVIGYQRWSNGRIDIALDMEGTRFIPLDALLEGGLFYR
jgi:hypothetical protein